MIAAIADDLTGAAEIAGLGWRYGLNAKIVRRDQPPPAADLLVYDSDSRHCSAAQAARRVEVIARKLQRKSPLWVFKKTDSVLRGNVLAEAEAMRCAFGLARILLVPANPGAGRVIDGGRYFVEGVPLARTDFANDPTHPRASNSVLELLGAFAAVRVTTARAQGRVARHGVTVGDAGSQKDLARWAAKVNEGTLAAGGGEFFAALLADQGLVPRPGLPVRAEVKAGGQLFIAGSRSETCLRFVAASRSRDWPVFSMPTELQSGRGAIGTSLNQWSRRTAAAVRRHSKVLMTVGQAEVPGPGAGGRLESLLAEAAGKVLKSANVGTVCLEGGSTAAAVLNALNWTALEVECEHARGVTAVRASGVPGPLVILKPGSYAWPRSVLG